MYLFAGALLVIKPNTSQPSRMRQVIQFIFLALQAWSRPAGLRQVFNEGQGQLRDL